MKKLFLVLAFLLAACGGTSHTTEEVIMPEYPNNEPPPRGNMPVKTGWQKSGILKCQIPEGSLSMQADFPEADIYTVQFGIDKVPEPSGGNPTTFMAEATVSWRVEGGSVQRRLNISQGTEISAPAQGVGVIIRDVTPTVGFSGKGLPYTVSMQVTKGNRPTSAFPPQLRGVDATTVAAAGAITVAVPSDAGVTTVEVSAACVTVFPTPASDVLLQQLPASGGGTVLKETFVPSQGSHFIPLHPLCGKIQVVNMDQANPVDISITWGIDG